MLPLVHAAVALVIFTLQWTETRIPTCSPRPVRGHTRTRKCRHAVALKGEALYYLGALDRVVHHIVALNLAYVALTCPPHTITRAFNVRSIALSRPPAQGLGGSSIGEYRMGGSDMHARMIEQSSGEEDGDDDDDDDDDIIFATN